MKIISWNVNGLRAVIRKGALQSFLKTHDPDILCLQETKAEQTQVEIDLPEYEEYWNAAEKKGYSGTAIFTKRKPMSVLLDIPEECLGKKKLIDDQGRNANKEGRVIAAEFECFFVVSVYTPNAKPDLSRLTFKERQWDPAFLSYMKFLEQKKPVIFCGDANVAHEPIDLARPEENEGEHGYTKEERDGFSKLMNAGFVDTFRAAYPNKKDAYTWWSHWGNARERNVGWRIDYVCVSEQLKKKIVDAFILPNVVGSDHCPVGIEVKL